ncbi:MAG: hypothetical protein JXB23_15670 [Candidatus Aminicenantes bacterium]|nr:hypothetical protein [Candidatus Aminicenantes bacterium]
MRKFDRHKAFIPLFVSMCLCLIPFVSAQEQQPEVDLSGTAKKSISEKFEIGIHYGPWTLKPLSNLFEDDLLNEIGQEIRNKIRDELTDKYPTLVESSYEDALQFGTSGSNFGLEIRYYPEGKLGSFSIGFSLERTSIKIKADGNVRQNYANGTFAEVEASGFITTNPLTTNLSFRWDTNPRWRVSPYFVIGFGLAALVGKAGYEYLGTYTWAGPNEEIGESDEKSIKEWEEDIDTNLPSIFYLFQLQLGVRARILPNVSINAEAGIWDGFVFRIGAFYRF